MYNKSIDEVFELVESTKDGLTTKEANKRLNSNGKNVLNFKKKKVYLK